MSAADNLLQTTLPRNVDRRAWLAGMAFPGLLAAPAQHAVDASAALVIALGQEGR